jgi:PAS domain S-box-containing protein
MDAIRRSHDPSGDGLFECEHRLLIPGGAVRWISVRGQTYFEGDADRRRPARSVGASIDITHQRRSQDEQSKLAAAVAMSRDFIGIAMLDTRVDYLNPAALAMVGIGTLEEAREKKIADFMADRETVDKVLAGVRVDGYWAGEAQLRHFGDGSAIDVEITAFPIRDDLGNPTYLATVTRDIRERRKAEALHAQLEARLAQAARMEAIGRLAGGVAHDFNNMLTVILGYAEMGRAAGLSFETRLKQLTEIEMAARRSQEITRQLLGFSRQQIIEPVRLQLNELVAVLLHPLTRLIGEDVELTFHPAPDLWQITMDASQINQILLNLVVNARDAMPGGGRLTIETVNVNVSPEYSRFRPGATPGEYAVLAVSDNGVGMDAETMSHIFEPFFTTKWHNHGTGLGLATVFGIVRQNGGFVNVYSEPAHGATFRIYFPRTVVDSASPSMAAHAGVTHSGSGVVMLVEDDDLVRGLATIALESFGYTPLVAKNPAEALRLCAANATEIRLMLSDVVMPGMNGAELRDRVLALNPKIKVLFMSGYTSNVIVDRGVLKKGVNFISKPFDIDDLEMRLQEILAS